MLVSRAAAAVAAIGLAVLRREGLTAISSERRPREIENILDPISEEIHISEKSIPLEPLISPIIEQNYDNFLEEIANSDEKVLD